MDEESVLKTPAVMNRPGFDSLAFRHKPRFVRGFALPVMPWLKLSA